MNESQNVKTKRKSRAGKATFSSLVNIRRHGFSMLPWPGGNRMYGQQRLSTCPYPFGDFKKGKENRKSVTGVGEAMRWI